MWYFQPLIWPIIIGTLALLAIPHQALPAEQSLAIRRACDGDVRKLCPREYKARDADGIGACMKANSALISDRCVKAWLFEHQEDRK